MRTEKELLIASKEFASENRWLSWWHLVSTVSVLGALLAIAVSDLFWMARVTSSCVAGLVAVRLFVVYHDCQHGAILRHSPIGAGLMWLYGLIALTPPSVWNRSHDHHHKNNSKSFGANVGSYPIMTTHAYASASLVERFVYAAVRHPLNMALGYLTVFFWGMSLYPFLLSPARHYDGALAIVLHGGVIWYLSTFGWDVVVLGMLFPLLVASSLGAYLFYAQHNFPAARLKPRADWTLVDAALHSSSFMTMGPLMNWLTGNIGYHHVHHLNARIPFYRLPETMAALQELQSPGRTSLKPRDIAACLRLKLWCPERDRLVDFNGL
jgi:omega-6 fatty acid desaturase (delta-12 desaturase)